MDIEYYLKGELVNETVQGEDPSQVLPHLVHKYREIPLIPAQERQGKRNLASDYVDLTKYGITDVSYINENGYVVRIPEIDLEKAPIH